VRRLNKFISLHGIKALKEVVRDMGWKSFTVLYQRDDALVRLQEVLKDHGPQDAPITVRQLPYGDDFRLYIDFCLNILITCFMQTALEASSGVLGITHYFGLRQRKNHSDFASSERSEDDGGLPKLLYCYTGERKIIQIEKRNLLYFSY
jgi:hypothetical protein